MATNSKSFILGSFLFVLGLLISPTCNAWYGSDEGNYGKGSYFEGYGGVDHYNASSGWDGANGISAIDLPYARRCPNPKVCPASGPNWVQLYVINPLRGLLRTQFD